MRDFLGLRPLPVTTSIMFYDIEDSVRRKAKSPHELFMFNLAAFHLLLAPAAIVLKIGILGFLVPLCASFVVIAYTFLRARKTEQEGPWFVAAHWRLAKRRYRILLIAYAVSAAILGIGLLIASGSADKNMSGIMLTVFSRIAAVPLLITVMVCFVLESGSIYQAGRGEVPDAISKGFPPPADLRGRDAFVADMSQSAPPQ